MDLVSILALIVFFLCFLVIFILYSAGSVLDFLCSILFIYHVIYKRTKYFSTAFFYILSVGYIVDIITFLFMFLSYMIENETIYGISALLYYYSILLLGPWNTLMALNRFTAIWFWQQHDWYWRNRVIIAAMLIMFGYPFLVSIPVMAGNPYCFFHSTNETCIAILEKADLSSTISNGIHVIIAAIIGIATSFASKFSLITVTPETKKFQQFLLIQSILSLIFFGFNLFYTVHEKKPDNPILESILGMLSETYYIFFRLSSTMLLLMLSKTVRDSFTSFYRPFFCCCCCCCKKRPKNKERKIIKTKTASATVKIVS